MKILLISYAYDTFPMAVFTGSQRAFSFVKNIPDHKTQIDVISFGNRINTFLKSGNHGEQIYRVPDLISIAEGRLLGLLGAVKVSGNAAGTSDNNGIKPHKRYLYIPDRQLYWAIGVIRFATKLHRRKRYDIVLTTSPPESVHIAGYMLKKILGIPWVADLRDGWMFEPYLEIRKEKTGIRKRIETLLERKLLSGANRITAVTEPIAEDIIKRLNLSPRKVDIIYNGFDMDEWKSNNTDVHIIRDDLMRKKGLCMVHMGRLSAARNDRDTYPFLKALQNLSISSPKFKDEIKVFFIGVDKGKEIEIVKKMGLNEIVSFCPPVPKNTAIEYMKMADAQLLITSSSQGSIATSKLFDYMASGKPVLALADNNAAARIVNETGVGLTVPPTNISGIENALTNFISWWKNGSFPFTCNPREIKKYDRKTGARKMSKVLESAVL